MGWGGAEQDVVGQRLVEDGAARAAEGRDPAMAADALVREGAGQRAPRTQVPIEELGVHTGERRTGVRRLGAWRSSSSGGSRTCPAGTSELSPGRRRAAARRCCARRSGHRGKHTKASCGYWIWMFSSSDVL